MDTSPQNLDKIMRLLLAMQSGVPATREAALETFNKNKNAPGFNLCCMVLSTQRERPLDERRLAAIVLNNNSKNFFTRRFNPDEPIFREREAIKELLLKQFDEPEDKVSCFFALATAHAASHEWPRNWDNLFPTLISAIQAKNPVVSRHALYTLKEVLHRMVNRFSVLNAGAFSQAAAKLLEFIFPRWLERLQEMLRQYEELLRGGQPQPQLASLAEQTLLYSKCMHSVVVRGVEDIRQNAHCRELFKNVGQVQTGLLRLLTQAHPNGAGAFRKMGVKILCLITRTVVEMQLSQPLSFQDWVEPYLKLFCMSLQNLPQPLDADLAQFGAQALGFLNNVVACRMYDPSRVNAGIVIGGGGKVVADKGGLEQAQQKIGQLFQPKVVENICRLVLTKYLPLQAADLEQWRDGPEEFAMPDSQVGTPESLRQAAEKLMGVLAQRFPQLLGQILHQQLQQLWERYPPGQPMEGLPPMLAKDAVLSALSLCAEDLRKTLLELGFEEARFFRSLLQEMATPRARGPAVVHVAAVRAAGQWILWMPAEAQYEVGRLCLGLLGDRDLVLRLTVLDTLYKVLDGPDPGVAKRLLLEGKLLQPLLTSVFELLSQFELYESKELGFRLLQQVIGVLDDQVAVAMDVIGDKLPKAWAASADSEDTRIRMKLLNTLDLLVFNLGPASVRLHDYLLGIIRDCCGPAPQGRAGRAAADHLLLLSPGLELWTTVLRQAPGPSKALMEMFQVLVDLHRSGNLEEMDIRMQVIESYLFLVHPASSLGPNGPVPQMNEAEDPSFLVHYGEALVQLVDNLLLQNPIFDIVGMVLQLVETIAQLYPRHFQARYMGVLARGSLLLLQENLLETLRLRAQQQGPPSPHNQHNQQQQQQHNQQQQPELPSPQVPPQLLVWVCSSLSRLLLGSQEAFRGFVRGLTNQIRQPVLQGQRPPQPPAANIGEPVLPVCVAALVQQHTGKAGADLSEQMVMALLVDAWADQMDNSSRPLLRKLNALGLSSLIPTGDALLLQRVPTIVNLVSGAIACLEGDEVGYYPNFHEARQKPLHLRTDLERSALVHGLAPECHVQLQPFAYQKMSQLAQMDKQVFDKVTSQIHPSALKLLQQQPAKRQ